MKNGTVAYLEALPTCDMTDCSETASYDSVTLWGPWAYLCTIHFGSIGAGRLGTGFAQELKVRK